MMTTSDNINFWSQRDFKPWYEYGILNDDIKTIVTFNIPMFDVVNLKTLISENHILNGYEKFYLCATIDHLEYNCNDRNVNCIIVTKGKEQLMKCNFTNYVNNEKVIYIQYETVESNTYFGKLNPLVNTSKRKRNIYIEMVIGAFGLGFACGYFICKKLLNV